MSALPVFVGTTQFALSTQQFAMIDILLECLWLLPALLIGRNAASRYRCPE